MENVIASDGTVLLLDSSAMTFSYNADDTVNYCEVSQSGNTYRQTFTHVNGNVTSISRWVKQ